MLGPGDYDGDGGSQPVLRLPGTPAAPVLPKVESLNPGGLFSYSVRLVVGNLYPLEQPPPPDGTELKPLPAQVLVLVVTMTPRFAPNKMQRLYFEGSLLLRRVEAVLPAMQNGSRSAQIDIWTAGNVGTSGGDTAALPTVQPKGLTIRRDTTVSILDSKIYDLDE